MDKFMGVGLKKLVGITIFVWLFTVMAKTIVAKYPIPGVSEIIHAV